MADVVRLDAARSLVTPPDSLESSGPFQSDNLCTAPQDDRWSLFDPPREVAGHGLRQPVSPDKQVDASCGLREKHRGLSGRIAAPDDRDLVAQTELRFHGCGT